MRFQNTNPYGLAETQLADAELSNVMQLLADGGREPAMKMMARSIKHGLVRHPEQDALFHKLNAETRNKHAILQRIQKAVRGEAV